MQATEAVRRKVLFFHERWDGAQWPHYGLVLLATKLRALGHNASVIDYNYAADAPGVEESIAEFGPDIVGVSLYTISMDRSRALIKRIRAATTAPVILGGPHASLYFEDLKTEGIGDWMFVGESEHALPARLHEIKREATTVVVCEPPPDIGEVPAANFGVAWGGYSRMAYRPIQLSRGCPYACSFCSVKCISSRKIRYRDMERCLTEIEHDVRSYPQLGFIRIVDDCPTFDRVRFNAFLRAYEKRAIGYPLHIDNLRGDGIDDEMLILLKRIGVDHLCIGVESGDEQTFNMVNKGETLDEIIEACKTVKRHGIRLYTCFVIGLPGATPAADMRSIALARRLKPQWVFWNLFQPHKGTKAREWFETHGTLYSEEGKTSIAGIDLTATEPPCETPDYPRSERARMQLKAMLATGCYLLNPFWFWRMSRTISRMKLWATFWKGLPSVLRVNAEMVLHRAWRQIKIGHFTDLSGWRTPERGHRREHVSI